MAEGPERADVGADACPGDDVHFDAIFFQDLDDANVGEAFGRARRKGQTDQASADFSSQSADIGPKRRGQRGLRNDLVGTVMDERWGTETA